MTRRKPIPTAEEWEAGRKAIQAQWSEEERERRLHGLTRTRKRWDLPTARLAPRVSRAVRDAESALDPFAEPE